MTHGVGTGRPVNVGSERAADRRCMGRTRYGSWRDQPTAAFLDRLPGYPESQTEHENSRIRNAGRRGEAMDIHLPPNVNPPLFTPI